MRSRSSVGLLTGGSDKPYAIGLASALAAHGIAVEFIGSDELECSEVTANPSIAFLNLRGDQREDAPLAAKIKRIAIYYGRLLRYAATTTAPVLHLLWNNKFELVDRTLLMAYYKAAGKRIVLTAHNVNRAARDGEDSRLNRWSLRAQYRLCDHLFVHTEAMKQQLISAFGVASDRVTVIPFGINDTVPRSSLTGAAARTALGIAEGARTLLFFGQIAPYKGLQYLVAAVAALAKAGDGVRLIIAGKVKRGSEAYWSEVQRSIQTLGIEDLVVQHVRFIPDDQVEAYFKASDVVVIPYVDIFQSGVPFLAFSFGVPVIATDVGSLHEDVAPETGLLCRPRDPDDLARTIVDFYRGPLYQEREGTRARIRRFAEERHSWDTVAERTRAVYESLARNGRGARVVSSSEARPTASKCPE